VLTATTRHDHSMLLSSVLGRFRVFMLSLLRIHPSHFLCSLVVLSLPRLGARSPSIIGVGGWSRRPPFQPCVPRACSSAGRGYC
jgi:hypothetical protein